MTLKTSHVLFQVSAQRKISAELPPKSWVLKEAEALAHNQAEARLIVAAEYTNTTSLRLRRKEWVCEGGSNNRKRRRKVCKFNNNTEEDLLWRQRRGTRERARLQASFFLQWGNRKRLRCVRVKDPRISARLNGGIRRKLSSQWIIVLGSLFLRKKLPIFIINNPIASQGGYNNNNPRIIIILFFLSLWNSDGAILRSAAGENRKPASSPEKEDRYYTRRGVRRRRTVKSPAITMERREPLFGQSFTSPSLARERGRFSCHEGLQASSETQKEG
ncbi:hypothetical protein SESBI_06190 [Sesbania bispinosa]|nr:hypothetical protein SESBI_06190 [Sesbania bispinosa]